MRKLFSLFVFVLYIISSSIFVHAEMMNDFSMEHNFSQGCEHFQNHDNHTKQDNSKHHQSCLDSIQVWYKILSPIEQDLIYKFKENKKLLSHNDFDYIISENKFNLQKSNYPPPIMVDIKYHNFSDLKGIIVMLN